MTGPGSSPAALDVACREGLAHHQAGQLEAARERYQQVLAADPNHFGALHLLGVYCIQTGQLEAAAELIRQAASIRADVPDAFGNLANALNALGRHEEAATAAERAIALNPNFLAAHANRGDALVQLGRYEGALESYDRVLALAPTAQAHLDRATVLRELRRRDEALSAYDRAIAMQPGEPRAHRGRAIVLRELGRPMEALESHDAAIALQPGYAEAYNNRGNVLLDLGRPQEALASYEIAATLTPDDPAPHSHQVAALRALGRHDEALAAADRALALNPCRVEAHNGRGAVLFDLRRLDEALGSYDQVIALRPDHAEAFNNRGAVLTELRRLDEAMDSYDRAVALDPGFADAHHNQAMCRLALGDFAAGWTQYEWRWRTPQLASPRPPFAAPLWLGEQSVEGRTVLIHAEQGLGDTLQFCRYAQDVVALGADVILEVQAGLQRLMQGLTPPVRVITRGDPLPPHDLQIPLMSLPLALGATPEPRAPYLHVSPDDAAAWRDRLAPGMRIGLCWAGGLRPDQIVANAIDQRRSLSLEAFAPLAAVEGVTVYSLQKGPPAAQLAELTAAGWDGPTIIDLTSQMKDFADTAGLVANLDLVITCDTAVAHLAGGMGKPVWILNRFDACWRWLDGRTDTPWYGSARLFNQPFPGDWASVVDEVIRALRATV